ncbi:MAG TPA: hypothetical protein VK602_16265, partial [Phyllobacterium sp.]|nr:hypothetical protein [Phyllobacterium sp.]
MPATSSPRASKIDILEVLTPLLRTMPTKGKVQDRMEGYFIALAQFTRADIEAGVRKFLSGQCAGVKSEFVPLPPQLAQIVRDVSGVEEAHRKAEEASTKYHAFAKPQSKLLARGITRDQVREGRGGGIYPPGCIWCPPPLGDGGESRDFGDLYAPDPDWRPSRP